MAAILFDDGLPGAVGLRNNFPAGNPAGRFANWVPMTRPFGDSVPRLSDGAITFFENRTDYGASFELPYIPIKAQSGGSNVVAMADRLIAWLIKGGTCQVYCEDTPATVYLNCSLWPGFTPTLRITNKQTLEYTLSLQLVNLSGARMDCVYL